MAATVWIHIICTLLSYAAFLVAFVSGILFLVQERQLKTKKMGPLFYWLPSLGGLDKINLWAIGMGFALLSTGVAFGLYGTYRFFGTWWTGDSKEYLAIGLWVWYCVLWLVRMRSTLRGRRVALLSILGFSFVVFTFIGASLIFTSGHPYTTSGTPEPGARGMFLEAKHFQPPCFDTGYTPVRASEWTSLLSA